MHRRFGSLVLMIALVIGCSSGEPPPVAGTDDDDPVLQAATAQARKTVGEFISRLEKPAAGEIFSVRAAFREGAVAEQLWLSEVRFDGKNFTGKVDDTPERLTAVKAGQTHQVSPEQISDWMILENNRLVGAYTIRALRDQIPPNQRAKWDREMGFSIDEAKSEPAATDSLRSKLFDSVHHD
jgi:uncharacterized protein YegJ (DUF2314 family)